MRERRPFEQSYDDRQFARAQFNVFRAHAVEDVMAAAGRVRWHSLLRNHYSFYVTLDDPDTVQVWFGARPMGRKDLDGKPAVEDGPHLL